MNDATLVARSVHWRRPPGSRATHWPPPASVRQGKPDPVQARAQPVDHQMMAGAEPPIDVGLPERIISLARPTSGE